jgi:hypothetical protein
MTEILLCHRHRGEYGRDPLCRECRTLGGQPKQPATRLRWKPVAVGWTVLFLTVAAFILGVIVGNTPGQPLHQDTTVAPCSAWDGTAAPTFDGPIIPDLCVAPDGSILRAPSSR